MDSKARAEGAVWAIGLMSGTSCDGIDAALIHTDGTSIDDFGATLTLSYDGAFRARLQSCFGGKGPVAAVERELTERHAEAVRQLLALAKRQPSEIAVVGFHGQTIHHAPAHRQTVQIGDGALLAKLSGIDVVNDFRSADVQAGGQGAPLAPVYHLARAQGLAKPIAVLNLGGVGNVTWIGDDGMLLAFDTGPANALLDDWALRHTGKPVDVGGTLAAGGRPSDAALAKLKSDPYFALPAPKSLDRQHFKALADAALSGLGAADGAATLVAFTAWSAAEATRVFPAQPREWLVCGGGRHNPAIMQALRAFLPCPVRSVDEISWDGDALEAQAFAFMAVRSLRGLPLSFPGTTGVPKPMPGGKLHRGA
ncbi:anhydro-N-acetylmuramic acid kinase [Dongia deserti]|uniref:anhydro-N-acetylmuramic acid kinase n=1 Tax=Dongia deserti TaxID=2268030 RepID=UPI000E64EB6F|nr:anhydro-N-acetylmuramic acid kinase [Dongia deserti]